MSTLDKSCLAAGAYISSVRSLIANPRQFFAESRNSTDHGYLELLIFTFLPIFIGSALISWQKGSWLWMIVYILAGYLAIAIWALVLKIVLPFFGERHDFSSLAFIVCASAYSFVLTWIPLIGPPLTLVAAGYFNVCGLIFRFKMDLSAAVSAVALPVVVSGLVGVVLSFILLMIASLTQVVSQ